MRILYFHQHFSTRSGATGTRSYEMAQALLKSGHEVHMVCGSYQLANSGLSCEFNRGKRQGIVDGIRVTELEIPYSNSDSFTTRTIAFVKFAMRSVRIALQDKYDLLFATSTPLTAGIPGIAARVLRRKKFVFEVRDLWPELPREMGVIKNPVVLFCMSVLEWVSYRAATACVGLSPGMVEGIRKRSSANKPIALIPNGCDVDLFQTSTSKVEVGARPFTAIFSGAHGKANGLDAVLDAAAVLMQRGETHIHIEFIGDGSEKVRLEKRASDEALSNCTFSPAMPKTELVTKLQTVDVGLMVLDNVKAFYNGTSPNKFFDYIASGLPVLNNYPGWIASIIDEYQLGIAVPPSDADLFADALVKMAADTESLRKMSQSALRCATERFNRAQLTAEFVNYLENVHRGTTDSV